MKNVYVGDAVISIDLRRMYEGYFEDMRGNVWINEDEGILEILLYEDYKISNNPFSDVTNFPFGVTFSFQKLIPEEDFVYNMWEIHIPIDLIERITEEYEEDLPGHEYNILFKDGSQVQIIGTCIWSNNDRSSCILDPEIDDVIHDQCDVYNKVYIACEITERNILINHLKYKISSEANYYERLTNPIRKVATSRKIEEIRKRLMELEQEQ